MLEQFLENIKNPAAEFTPVPFWFFNDEPDEEKISRQLADYVQKGVNGIVIHPRIGVPEEIPYLSEAYFQVVKFVVRTARQLGMKVVLYDEGMYPSGSAHGLVVAENADYASKGITLSDSAEGGQVIVQFPDGKYLVYGFTRGTIRGIHYGEDDGEEGAPPSADILNPDAVNAFIRLTHERYYEELQEYFGDTVIAFFTDEPCPLGRNAGGFREWAAGMEAEILAEGGKLAELEGLFCGRENRTTRIYHRLIKKHLREVYYARLSGWCETHGVALMGHPEASDDVEEEVYFHIPGQDLIMRRVSPETGGIREFDSVQAKLPADIARYLGRRRNANECFGVCSHKNIPWYFKGYDMKWYINWLGIRGVNLFVPHAFYYSVAGPRKEERPPDVGPYNIWWHHYRLFSDYMKRISYLMTDAVSLARVAVLCDNNRVPAGEVAGLYEHQIDFHYLPVAMLNDCVVRENKLCIGSCRFDVVVDLYGYREQETYAACLAGVRVVDEAAVLYSRIGGSTCTYGMQSADEIAVLYPGQADQSMSVRNSDADETTAVYSRQIGQSMSVHGSDEDEAVALYAEHHCYTASEKDSGRRIAGQSDSPAWKDIDCRTVVTDCDSPWLRVVHMEKEGVSWYLFSNEGAETIETSIHVKEMENGKKPFWMNLWDGCVEEVICTDEISMKVNLSSSFVTDRVMASNMKQGVSQNEGAFVSPKVPSPFDGAGKLAQNEGSFIRLKLEHCEMKLLIFAGEGEEHLVEKYHPEFGTTRAVEGAFLGDWTDRFERVDCVDSSGIFAPREEAADTDMNANSSGIFAPRDRAADTDVDADKEANTIVYRCTYCVPEGRTVTGAECFRVHGEEMAECVCNGIFAGVSFYGPHTFRIGQLLREGENEICIRFTGNAANLYGDVKVPFGLDC